MKILLTAINAKYIHSNLAVYSLKTYAEQTLKKSKDELDIQIAEYTINQYIEEIREAIYMEHPDVIAFSCYIWNISIVEQLLPDLGKLLPHTDIWLGGPEVSWSADTYLSDGRNVFGIMVGEGEKIFANLCRYYLGEMQLSEVRGICFRGKDGKMASNGQEEPLAMEELPFVYQDLSPFKNKILYYETSRGCPFSCSYCLSSIDKKLRFRPFSLVKEELRFFLEQQVAQVKFVDRTFNCNHEHAMEIWRFLKEHDNGVTNFHFEIAADLLREDEIALLNTMRPGLVQLEIGVQSTNSATLKEIRRSTSLDAIKRNTEAIRKAGNIHQHLDLIAGLPHEGYESFRRSFAEVYAMKPDQLQLGFLKVLHGSYMQEMAGTYGSVYSSRPPYEVLYTDWITHDEILCLKRVEEMVEMFYNSGQFRHTLGHVVDNYENPFDFYKELSDYYARKVPREMKVNRLRKYEILLEFLKDKQPDRAETAGELLVFDYYLRENAKSRPSFAADLRSCKEELRRLYRRYPQGAEVHAERFTKIGPLLGKEGTVYILFDYRVRNPLTKEAVWKMEYTSDE